MKFQLTSLYTGLAAAGLFLFPAPAPALDFETDIKPVLREKCFKCHSGPRAKGKLRYDNNEFLSKRIGEHEEAVIVPGKPLSSLLIQKASLPREDSDAMPPPRRGEPLSSSEIGLIKQWITEGAKLEKGDAPAGEPKPAPTPSPDANKLYSWTSTAGTSIQAAFVRLEERAVILKKEDGMEIKVAMTQLSAESRKQATNLATGASSN